MKYLIFLVPFFLFSCVNSQSANMSEKEIYYRSSLTNLIEVINLTRPWASLEDYEYIQKPTYVYGEFEGGIILCSNQEFYCLKGGLTVVLPKENLSLKEWAAEGVICKADNAISVDETSTITCQYTNKSVAFTYSLAKGVTSFVRSSDHEERFSLVGDKGLFAQE